MQFSEQTAAPAPAGSTAQVAVGVPCRRSQTAREGSVSIFRYMAFSKQPSHWSGNVTNRSPNADFLFAVMAVLLSLACEIHRWKKSGVNEAGSCGMLFPAHRNEDLMGCTTALCVAASFVVYQLEVTCSVQLPYSQWIYFWEELDGQRIGPRRGRGRGGGRDQTLAPNSSSNKAILLHNTGYDRVDEPTTTTTTEGAGERERQTNERS